MTSDDPPSIGAAGSLGQEQDHADAGVIREIAAALERSIHAGKARRVLREAMWFLWEEPRLPRPRIAGKYPLAYPWSPAARARAESGDRRSSGGRLVIEHAIPRTMLVRQLMEGAQARVTEDVLQLLQNGTHASVITVDDDRLLTDAGVRDRLPPGADPHDLWARYRAAGLDPSQFRTLHDPTDVVGPHHQDASGEQLAPLSWDDVRAAARAAATAAHVGSAPDAPGVYVWFREGAPVYVGISGSLRDRLRHHRSSRTRPRKSTLRASVGVLVTGQPRAVLRAAGRYEPQEAALIDAWLDGCEVVWFPTGSRAAARASEKALLRVWWPQLNLAT